LGDLFNIIYTGDHTHLNAPVPLGEELDYFTSSNSTFSITTFRTFEGISVD
jgi:hypothetical protein